MIVDGKFVTVVKRPPTEPGDILLSPWAEIAVSASVPNTSRIRDLGQRVTGEVIGAMEVFDPDEADCLMNPLQERFNQLIADPVLRVEFRTASYDTIEDYIDEVELNT